MYADYFGFKFHPFSPAVDKRLFYPSTAVTQALAVLQHALTDNDRLMVLSGPAGTGKTCLINKFLGELQPQVKQAVLPGDDYSDLELLQLLAFELGVDDKDCSRVQLFSRITRELRRLSTRSIRIIVVVDNAHLLSRESLRVVDKLVDAQAMGNYAATFLLAGRTELPKKLVKEFGSLRDQRFRLMSTLHAMSAEDTLGYINYRLMKSGVPEQAIFRKEVVRAVYSLTQGVPHRVNALCDIALLGAFAKQKKLIELAHLEQAARKLGWSIKRKDGSAIPVVTKNQSGAGKNGNCVHVKDVSGNTVSYELGDEVVRIGRAPDCEIRIDELSISRYQAEIVPDDDGYLICNRGSTTPVMLNANSVTEAAVQNGDVVSIGNYVFHFELPGKSADSDEQQPEAQSN
ncbi:AAA family ATPase [Granulosicoccaceae sp. 1_MG-2023]|nr:AAA family ATPase [Granulosicoccaceae sp. 1_MG-2023]